MVGIGIVVVSLIRFPDQKIVASYPTQPEEPVKLVEREPEPVVIPEPEMTAAIEEADPDPVLPFEVHGQRQGFPNAHILERRVFHIEYYGRLRCYLTDPPGSS